MEERRSAQDVSANQGLLNVRDPRLSLWQSAADKVANLVGKYDQPYRPPPDESYPLIHNVGRMVERFHEAGPEQPRSTARTSISLLKTTPTISLPGCARIVRWLIRNPSQLIRHPIGSLQELAKPFGDCDLRYLLCIWEYIKFRTSRSFQLFKGRGSTPYYRTYDEQHTFVIDDRLAEDEDGSTRIGLVADWGTGQEEAEGLLEKLKQKEPHVVIHLGDIYYSGTKYEAKNYFYRTWQEVLGIPKIDWGKKLEDQKSGPYTFTMSGNHDMYSGGKPYYTLIDMLGQPASYFCLRNEHWQFVALDTGVNGADPLSNEPTRLQDQEVQWLKDRIAQADGRKTVLLSHHQLFSNDETFKGKPVNENLYEQVKDILSAVTVWFWGHEHTLVVYKRFEVADGLEILGRCIGHGAFPVGVHEDSDPIEPEIPVEDVHLAEDRKDPFLQHGYVLMKLQNDTAEACYYEYDAGQKRERMLCKDIWRKEGWEFQNFLQIPPGDQSR
jgi:predicted phosphodiesterase